MSKTRTISNHFDDDEIIGRLPNGDLVLHMGVKRAQYNSFDTDLTSSEEHINYAALNKEKNKKSLDRYRDIDPMEDEIDDWLTE